MRRSTLLAIPVTRDVCIFCATRAQFASIPPALRPQRRLFKSSSAPQRPPAAAAAQKEEDGADDWNTDWKAEPASRQSGNGWASDAAPRALTPEEQALRNALQTHSSFSPQIRKHELVADDRRNHRTQEGADGGFQGGTRINSSPLPQSHKGNGSKRTPSSSSGYHRKPYAQDQTGLFGVTDSQPPKVQQATNQSARGDAQFGTSHNTSRQASRALHWDCPSCGCRNFRRQTCRQCRSDMPADISEKPSLLSASPLNRIDRDAQLDHHIAQTRDRREGDGDCTNCGFDLNRGNTRCRRCGVIRLKRGTQEVTAALHADNWKHLRRRDDISAEQHGLSNRFTDAGSAKDSAVDIRTRTAEQERMRRLERTRDGRYVDPRRGQDFVREGVETRTPQHKDGVSRNIFRTEKSRSAPSKSNEDWATWEPLPTNEYDSNQLMKLGEAAPSPRATGSLKGWDYPIEGSGVSGSSSQAMDANAVFTTENIPKKSSRIRTHISYDGDFDKDRVPRRPRETESSMTQGNERRGRNTGIEITSIPKARSRYKERKSKNFVSEVDLDEDDEDVLRAERRKQRKQKVERNKAFQKAAAAPTPLYLPEFISVSNLAAVLRVRVEDFAFKMKDLGFAETNNDYVLDVETAGLIAAEFNYEPIIEHSEERDLLPLPPTQDKSVLPARPPVVTIMGHVDHGKTTLLDFLRKSSVAASEYGGITQHIGAFSVPMPGGRLVTFLDTPGHEAFLSMRQRGANVTDIVILVVAADDSVKPQTVEAIRHAQAAKVPMIVAVNKIDKEDSNVEKVKQDLARYGVEIEDFGGDTQVVCVSGKTGEGMEELEDAAVALADILDMRSEVNGQAEGWVLEATTKKAGRVATVLVRRGTLRPGDVIVAGTSWARVRSLRNEASLMVPSAGPGTPVEIDGWREQPAAGDEVIQAPDEQKAKSVISYRLEASGRTKMAADMEAVNEARRLEQEKRDQLEKAAQLAETNPNTTAATPSTPQIQDPTATPTPAAAPTSQEIFFIIKADVSGSVEAITNSVSSLGTPEIRPHILRSAVGPVTEFDIDHAAVANGHIISFNTPIDGPILRLAESKGVDIIDQSIIYRLVDEVRAKLGERLAPTVTRRVLGEAEVARVFEINTKGRATVPVAGCRVRNGVVSKAGTVRVLRGKEVVFDGALSSLKNVKKDVTEMRKGNECGMSFEGWTGFQVGDQVQAYEESVEKRTL